MDLPMPDVLTAASDLGWPLVTRYLGIDLVDQLAPLAAATLLLEILGPVVLQFALRRAGEAAQPRKP